MRTKTRENKFQSCVAVGWLLAPGWAGTCTVSTGRRQYAATSRAAREQAIPARPAAGEAAVRPGQRGKIHPVGVISTHKKILQFIGKYG